MSLIKDDLINKLTQQIGFKKTESKEIVNLFFEIIKKRLLNKEEVKLSGFGNFNIRYKKSRPARNPRTGEYALVSARNANTINSKSTALKCILRYQSYQNLRFILQSERLLSFVN
ncbi:Integration host factor alpha subunit [hydrothermal vent metagenome]|uniref:Integration host factor alpha subunit n=1 Tax=hydrothermal vent metagenome TaxID=652676 RepID=A0A1W1C260_9ZZZZ